jgi:LuxR family maltose regulon positive regulatory protein
VAWLTVTERDNQAAVFWTHLHLALALVGAVTADAAPRPMFPDEADIDALCTRILQLAVPVVLVIDAAEKLTAPTVYDQLRRLMDAGGDRFRVVLCSRVEPPLSLHRYRVENRVTEIRADDLALGRDEVGQVLGQHGLPPSQELIGRVLARTEGWVAGVRLAALELAADGRDARLDAFAAPYVRAEVVARLTAAERDILAATAVVDELDPGLAPALTDRADADDLLRTMSSGNAYVLPVRDRPGVLRLHPLVRELLLADLERAAPQRVAALHRRAAAWYDGRGRLEPAVHHLAAAGDWPAAAARIVEGRGLAEVVVGTSTGAALATELAGLPDTDSADGAVLRAAIALRDGDLDRARAALDRAAPATSAGRRVAASLVRTAWADAARRPADVLEAARETRSVLAEVESPDPLTGAAIATAEGAAQLRAGDLDAARAALDEAVSTTADADGPLRLRCLSELALAEACAGRLTRALELTDAADRAAIGQGVPTTSRPLAVELARAWVALERQDLGLAKRSLDRLRRARGARTDETGKMITTLLRARYLRDRGDVRGARRELGRLESSARWLRVHLEVESRSLDAVDPRATPGDSPATPGDTAHGRLEDLLQLADRRCRAGDLAAARVDVGRALALGRTERLRRPFAHASPRILGLIRSDAQMQADAGWLRRDELTGDGDPTPAPQQAVVPVVGPVVDALTGRELEVLRHLAAFLTTEEVAAEMFISVNTVRTHVRRVLEKLSVSRRNEAVRRGRELGLV